LRQLCDVKNAFARICVTFPRIVARGHRPYFCLPFYSAVQ
jgi:hypothetical protein